MERLRQMTLLAAAVACGGGCAATDRLTAHYHDARKAVGVGEEARPASQVSLLFERRLQSLPDPTRPDATQPGLPGQLFVTAADGLPTEATGPVTVVVTDKTPRPAGQPPRPTEKWEFTPDVLARLRVSRGQQLGSCYVLFLPWPKEWTDVTRVTVQAHYKPAAGGVELYATENHVTLDLGGQGLESTGWVKADNFKVPAAPGQKPGDAPPPAFALPPPQQSAPVLPPPGPLTVPGTVTPPAGIGGPQTITIPRS